MSYDDELVDALLFLVGYNQGDIAVLMYDAMTEGSINYYDLIKVARLYDKRFGSEILKRFKEEIKKGDEKNE